MKLLHPSTLHWGITCFENTLTMSKDMFGNRERYNVKYIRFGEIHRLQPRYIKEEKEGGR